MRTSKTLNTDTFHAVLDSCGIMKYTIIFCGNNNPISLSIFLWKSFRTLNVNNINIKQNETLNEYFTNINLRLSLITPDTQEFDLTNILPNLTLDLQIIFFVDNNFKKRPVLYRETSQTILINYISIWSDKCTVKWKYYWRTYHDSIKFSIVSNKIKIVRVTQMLKSNKEVLNVN